MFQARFARKNAAVRCSSWLQNIQQLPLFISHAYKFSVFSTIFNIHLWDLQKYFCIVALLAR